METPRRTPIHASLTRPLLLGGAEREKTEAILSELSPAIRRLYARATTYHDGKWLAIPVDNEEILREVERLLLIKRRSKSSPRQ